jgi:hypothetical protein
MLFLAVTAGFFVENQREHLVEHQREIRYARNLLQDLSRDTAAMQMHLRFQKRAVIYADSLIDIINSPEKNTHLSEIYYYARILSILNPIQYSNATISQLRNSGSLRLIRQEFVSDSIVQYDIWAQRLLAVDANIATVIQDFRTSMGYLFDARVIKSMIDTSAFKGEGGFGTFLKRPQLPKPLITEDRGSINQLCNYAGFLLALYQNHFKSMMSQRGRAIRLMQLLKKEYHLK